MSKESLLLEGGIDWSQLFQYGFAVTAFSAVMVSIWLVWGIFKELDQ